MVKIAMQKNNKKVLLINPTSIHHGPPDNIKETDDFINKKYVSTINKIIDERCPENKGKAMHSKYTTNYGLLMLATLLKKDYDVAYTNGDYFSSSDEYINYLINDINNYDLVSMTSTTPQFNEIKGIAKLLKQVKPSLKVVLGGPHTRYYLTHDVEDYFDCVFIGYGIDKSKEIIDKITNNIPVDKKIITDYYYDVDKDFSVIPNDKIDDTMLYSYINFGCPNNCKYCVEHRLVDKMAFNCTDKKINEIKELVCNHNVKFVHIADSDFLMFKATVEKFIDFIEKEKLNFCFSINTSPITIQKYINDPIINKLKEIGLIEVLIGAEHFSKKVLERMAKNYDIDQFISSLDYIKNEVKIPIVSLYTLVGLPGEYEEEIQENLNTIRYMSNNKLFDFTFPKFFVPYPDSEIYLHPEEYDAIIKNENWEEYQRWQLPRPININRMKDQDYINEIIEINKITMKGDEYENNSCRSMCKKR